MVRLLSVRGSMHNLCTSGYAVVRHAHTAQGSVLVLKAVCAPVNTENLTKDLHPSPK